MTSPRILFMGTPDFAAVQLEHLARNGYDVAGVVCRPDSARDRGMKLAPPPVKETALRLLPGVPVYQPVTLRDGAADAMLRETRPDLIVVVAYGRILPADVLNAPPLGCINLHGSVLPAYRGAAPIQRAVIHGDRETGLSLMYLSEGMDEGDVVDVLRTEIGPDETYGELSARLAGLGAPFLAAGIDRIAAGTVVRTPQDGAAATYAPMIEKAEARLDFSRPARQVYDLFRGVTPNPGATAVKGDKPLRVAAMRLFAGSVPALAAGSVFFPTKKTVAVVCGDGGAVELLRVAPAGKKELAAADWINGRGVSAGDVLG